MGPVRRLVVAEVEGGPPREEQRHELLAGRVVAELLRQVVRDAEPLSGVGEVAGAPSPIRCPASMRAKRLSGTDRPRATSAIATAASLSPA